VLLTGAAGQVGSEVSALASGFGLEVVGTDADTLDITDGQAVQDAIDAHTPRIVVNAAAYTAVDKAESDRALAFAVNTEGPRRLAEACARRDLPLLHISTDYVFDGSKTEAWVETDPANPLGVYGASKWAGEEAVRETHARHLVLRVAWVFGARGHNFVKTMLRLGREREELGIVGDQAGGPTPAADIARTLLELARRALRGDAVWGTYHYCGAPATTWHGFALAIFEAAAAKGLLDRPPRVKAIATADYPTPAQRPVNSILDCASIRATYGIEQPDWRAGLDAVLEQMAREAP
jgi:dTDP-4-dehydrorhamnose reductase